jgi:uncharacterized phage protein gp47/JayE
MSGLTPQGFEAKTVEQIIDELEAQQASTVDGSLNTSSTGVIANLNMSFALQLAQVWELMQEVYDSHDPNSAEGVALDHNGALTGSIREPAAPSEVTLQLSLTGSVTVPAGSIVSDPASPTVRFATLSAVTNPSGTNNYLVQAASTSTGPIAAAAGTLTKIESPIPGWTAVTNTVAADLGNDVETDEQYRIRRAQEIYAQSGSTVDGLRAALLQVPGVIDCNILENDTDFTDSDGTGLPPHSFEPVVLGGADADIAQAIWLAKPAGIEVAGSSSYVITDSEGVSHPMYFTRPTAIVINAKYDVTEASPTTYVPNSVRTALIAASIDPSHPAYFGIGTTVYLVRLLAVAQAVQGVVNFSMDIALAPTVPPDAIPTAPSYQLDIDYRAYATFTGATWSGP